MTAAATQKIARLFPSRSQYYYVTTKLKTDPLYTAVHRELSGSQLPLMDLGCGLGVLAYFLRENGLKFPIRGLDYDESKIVAANDAILRSGHEDLSFSHHDAREGLPEHSGNVTILDILQFFTPAQQKELLTLAAERVPPGGKLIVRSCLKSTSKRFKVTVAGDLLAKYTFWMKAAPTHYPTEEDFREALAPFGTVTISPLWGKTPFNNHLITLCR